MVQLMPLPPHCLLLHESSDWFNLSGAGLPRLSRKRDHKTVCVVCQQAEEATDKEELFTAILEDDITLPDTAEVDAERERRRRFDEEWNSINEVLSSFPLEPMIVNVSTKPDEDAESGPLMPRTTTEFAQESLETVHSRFCFSLGCDSPVMMQDLQLPDLRLFSAVT